MKTLQRQKVNIVVGRFQPFTEGHLKCIEYAWKQTGLPTIIALVNTLDNKVDSRHPFPASMLLPIYKECFKQNIKIKDIILVTKANIVEMGEKVYDLGYEIAAWTCGTDRIAKFEPMAKRYAVEAHLSNDFQMLEVPRTDEDISATKVRQALMDDDEKTFQKLTPYKKLCSTSKYKSIYNDMKIQLNKVNNQTNENLVQYLKESMQVNEVITELMIGGLLTLAFAPLLNSMTSKMSSKESSKKSNDSDSGGGFWDFIGGLFNSERRADRKLDKKERELDRKERELALKKREEEIKKHEEKMNQEAGLDKNATPDDLKKNMLSTLMLSRQLNDKEKDEVKKQEADSTMKLISACMFDENGEEVPFEKMGEKFQELMPDNSDTKEWLKNIKSSYDDVSSNQKLKEQIREKQKNIKKEDLDKFVEDTKTEVKETWKNVNETKEKNKKIEEEIDDLQKQVENAKGDELKELKEKIDAKKEEIQKNSPFASINSNPKPKTKDENDDILKDEEVTDPETGKKIKVVTHTGPQGGKFYYPKGKPKTPEHKVYLPKNESLINKLKISLLK